MKKNNAWFLVMMSSLTGVSVLVLLVYFIIFVPVSKADDTKAITIKSLTASSSIISSSVTAVSSVPINLPTVSELKIQPFVSTATVILPVIMYHHILGWAGVEEDAIERGLRVSPEVFERHLLYIKENGYTTITTKDLYLSATVVKKLPTKPILLTFDDGYTDNYTLAYPLLTKYSMVGDFALITGRMGSKGFMTWNQAREMLKSGHYFSSHTVFHCYLAPRIKPGVYGVTPVEETYESCIDFNQGGTLTSGQVLWELQESKRALEKELAIPIVSLVYPYGNYNDSTVSIAKKAGYQIAFTTVGQSGEGVDLSDPLRIARYRGFGQDSTGSLQGFFAGGR